MNLIVLGAFCILIVLWVVVVISYKSIDLQQERFLVEVKIRTADENKPIGVFDILTPQGKNDLNEVVHVELEAGRVLILSKKDIWQESAVF